MNSLYTLALSFMLIYLAKCSTVRIEVLPESDNELITDEINITCTPKDIPLDTQDILSMELGLKGDDPLATLKGPTLQLGNDTKNNTRVKGNIAKNISESFLQLTMRKPFEDGVNVYYCRMLYQNEYRQHRMGVAYANVSIENNNKTVFINLLDHLSELENPTNDLEIKRDVDMADFVHLFKKVSNLENTIKEQERQCTAQNAKASQRIDVLEDEGKSRSRIMQGIVNQVYSRIDELQDASMNRSEVLRIINKVKGHDKAMFTHLLKNMSDLEENTKDLEKTIKEQERQLHAQDAKVSSRIDQLEVTGQNRSEAIQGIIDKDNDKAMLDHLRNKVLELEKYTQDLEETIKEQERQLEAQAAKVSSRIDQLEVAGQNRSETIQGIVDKDNNKAMFDHLRNKVLELEKSTQDLEETIKEQERQDAKVSSRIDQLEVAGQNRSETIQGIVDKDNDKSMLDHLRNKVLELEKYTQDLEETIKEQERQLETKAAKESSRIDQLEDTVRTLNQMTQGLVDRADNIFSAFSVYGTKEHFRYGEKLTFKYSILNIGYDYNLATGVYTAPKNGFYVFNLSAFAHSRHDLDLNLKLNGKTMSSLFVRNNYFHDQASVSAILKLNEGDRVWPSVKDGDKFTNLNDKYTVFNGFLLRLL